MRILQDALFSENHCGELIMRRQTVRRPKAHYSRESGQAAVFLMLGMGLFLLGGIGFAVDMANMWMHRQASQNAADAACTAAAMDMVNDANGATNSGGFTAGTGFNCSSNPTDRKSVV